MDDEAVFYYDAGAAAEVADEAILGVIAEDFADKELVVQAIVSPEDQSKLSGVPTDRLLAVYVMNEDGELELIEADMEETEDADGNTVEVAVYEVGEEAEVYLAYEAIPTTTTVETTTTTEATTTTESTTKATEPVDNDVEDDEAGFPWWIIVVAVVVVAAVVAVVIVMKKKGAAPTDAE